MPCHNEAAAIPDVIRRVKACLEEMVRAGTIGQSQILVVDDGSTDGSFQLLRKCSGVEVLRLEGRAGYGGALKAGFRAVRGDWIAFLDLDDTYDPKDLPQLLEFVSTSDVVMGERFSSGVGMPIVRRLGNNFFSALIRSLFGQPIRDACTGFRVFHRRHRDAICALPEDSLNFCLAMTIWMLRSECSWQEVAIAYHMRKGSSKLSVVQDGLRFLWIILSRRFFPSAPQGARG